MLGDSQANDVVWSQSRGNRLRGDRSCGRGRNNVRPDRSGIRGLCPHSAVVRTPGLCRIVFHRTAMSRRDLCRQSIGFHFDGCRTGNGRGPGSIAGIDRAGDLRWPGIGSGTAAAENCDRKRHDGRANAQGRAGHATRLAKRHTWNAFQRGRNWNGTPCRTRYSADRRILRRHG